MGAAEGWGGNESGNSALGDEREQVGHERTQVGLCPRESSVPPTARLSSWEHSQRTD
jgi:hypothetical protein